jgi:hypothetical protein
MRFGLIEVHVTSARSDPCEVGKDRTLGGFCGSCTGARVIPEGPSRNLPDTPKGTIMNPPRTRLALALFAPAVLGLGVTAFTQSPGTPLQTASLRTTTTTTTTSSPAPPASFKAELVNAGRGASSAACLREKRWRTGPQSGGTGSHVNSTAMSPSALYLTRVGRHACYDRVVFDINGSQAVSSVARYVPVVRADGSGQRVPVPGRAALEVIVRAPILGADNQGHQPWRKVPRIGQNVIAPSQISGWSSLRAVRFAGSFEGQTTMAVGVRERLPFRVFVISERHYQRVVLDISHRRPDLARRAAVHY